MGCVVLLTPAGFACAIIFTPIEILANRVKRRWVAFTLIQPVGGALPWIVSLVHRNPDFQSGPVQVSFFGAVTGSCCRQKVDGLKLSSRQVWARLCLEQRAAGQFR